MNTFELLFVALVLDAIFGEPKWLWSRVPHPVSLIGKCIDYFDDRFNTEDEPKEKGVFTILALVCGAIVIGYIIKFIPDWGVLEAIGAAILLSHKSLCEHVSKVAEAMKNDLGSARDAVGMLVGRNTSEMDEPAIARAAIESGAENFSDGVIAPAFWFLLFGLPGILAYKVVNTADSMIGYKNDKYKNFGWAAAKLDDLLNWIPARISGALICLAHLSKEAWNVMLRDASSHRSPNAGWPESAMAAVLDIALAGPRMYDGKMQDFNWLNYQGEKTATVDHIQNAVHSLWQTWFVVTAIIFLVAIL